VAESARSIPGRIDENKIEPKSRRTQGPKQDPDSFAKNMAFVGPGLVTGASDDDPSGIASYSQAGAQFGIASLWLALFSYPFMCAIQEISARIGRVTGVGISAYPQAFPSPRCVPSRGVVADLQHFQSWC